MVSVRTGLSAPGFNLFRRSRGRALLVVVQIGLAVVLLLSSGLLIRSFLKLSSVDPGYATTRVLTFQSRTVAQTVSAEVL